MLAYITYDRYERDEWYSVYHFSDDRDEAIKQCIEEDLPDFISYGPDDCHSFQLQEIEISKRTYNKIKKWIKEDQSLEDCGPNSSEFYDFMCELYDGGRCVDGEVSTLIFTDGCSDNIDVVHYYISHYMSDKIPDDEDEYDDLFDEISSTLYDDDELYTKVLKEYIAEEYS